MMSKRNMLVGMAISKYKKPPLTPKSTPNTAAGITLIAAAFRVRDGERTKKSTAYKIMLLTAMRKRVPVCFEICMATSILQF